MNLEASKEARDGFKRKLILQNFEEVMNLIFSQKY
jgi:hypothetical protein